MTREIKFRAWTGKEMVYNADFFDEYAEWGQGFLRATKLDQGDGSYELIPLMQFTGLKDRNSKEIYEGDIVFYEDKNWVTTWEYDRWDMRDKDDNGVRDNDLSDDPGYTNWEKSIVIGNIYEHSYLLNNGQ